MADLCEIVVCQVYVQCAILL